MHIGNFLSSELKKQRITIAEVAKAVNKSGTGVRKDLEKDSLHQSVIEAYSKVLGLNVYELLAEEWAGRGYKSPEPKEEDPDEFKEEDRPVYPQKSTETVSVTFQVPVSKKEALLKLLTD